MKKLNSLFFPFFIAISLLLSCTADDVEKPASVIPENSFMIPAGNDPGTARIASASVCSAYIISLESITQNGANWEWIWSVQNPNPGNGNNGTVQNLSHWGMQFGSCFIWSSVVGAAYSSNGNAWTSFTPVYTVDPSQSCMTTPVLKFDFGTTGNTPSYYKLVLNQNLQPGYVPGYFKSGSRTGCCTFNFMGVGCPEVVGEK